MTPEETINAVLLPFLKSAKRRADAVEQLIAALETEGHLIDGALDTVEVRDSKVGVETTELGGLSITLDAAGNAVRITSPYGLDVIA